MADKQSWHLNKSVPVGIIVTILIQFSGFVWLFSGLNSSVLELQKADVETSEVKKSFYALEANLDPMHAGQVRIETQLDKMDDRINRILERD